MSAALLWTVAPYAALARLRRASTGGSAPTAMRANPSSHNEDDSYDKKSDFKGLSRDLTITYFQAGTLEEQDMPLSNTTIATGSAGLGTKAGRKWNRPDDSGASEVAAKPGVPERGFDAGRWSPETMLHGRDPLRDCDMRNRLECWASPGLESLHAYAAWRRCYIVAV